MTEQPASEHSDVTADDVGDDVGRTTLGDVLRLLAVAACAGAAVIHFAYAPTHIEEDATHGTFFLVTAWLQLGLAFALARWRTDRRPWLAAGVVNGAVAGVWVLTRTAGLPGEDPEPIGFPDTLATALEVVVVLAAVAALRPAWARRPSFRPHPLVGGVAAVALAAVVSASVTPSIAGEH
jgi:peptidoglycan/LPS O-acetylase OafA/YrhL